MSKTTGPELFEYFLRLGDDLLIMGHRLSEWCGHAPILEEDIALANISLDCLGQATALLKEASQLENKNRTEDDIAFFRETTEFKNLLITELPRGDFGFTIARQFLFDAYSYFLYEKLQESDSEPLKGIAQKAYKEIKYHLRHSHEWVLRLGDGTDESHDKIQSSFDELWTYTGEFFDFDEVENSLWKQGIIPDYSKDFKIKWENLVHSVFEDATLTVPDNNQFMIKGGRKGIHSEHLGHLLSEMQIVARSFPGARW